MLVNFLFFLMRVILAKSNVNFICILPIFSNTKRMSYKVLNLIFVFNYFVRESDIKSLPCNFLGNFGHFFNDCRRSLQFRDRAIHIGLRPTRLGFTWIGAFGPTSFELRNFTSTFFSFLWEETSLLFSTKKSVFQLFGYLFSINRKLYSFTYLYLKVEI